MDSNLRDAFLYSIGATIVFLIFALLNKAIRRPAIGDRVAAVLGIGFTISLFMGLIYGIAFLWSIALDGDISE